MEQGQECRPTSRVLRVHAETSDERQGRQACLRRTLSQGLTLYSKRMRSLIYIKESNPQNWKLCYLAYGARLLRSAYLSVMYELESGSLCSGPFAPGIFIPICLYISICCRCISSISFTLFRVWSAVNTTPTPSMIPKISPPNIAFLSAMFNPPASQ